MRKVVNLLLVLAQVWSVAQSNQLMTSRGSWKQPSFSQKSKTKLQILYRLCLSKAPDFVYAVAKPSNQSLPFEFSLVVLEMNSGSFLVELERVDQASGWDTMITVDWFLYTGIALVHGKRVFWLPDLSETKTMNQEQSAIYCTNRGAELADIADKETYKLIYNHIAESHMYNTKIRSFVHAWLASKYNPQTRNVTQSNGEPGFNGYGKWRQPSFPSSGINDTVLAVRVRDYDSQDSGLLNFPPKQALGACTVVCSMKLLRNL
uniref:uncharacterized protein LOC100178198 isoform X2 n=1 Tax=Ciona intestinalis TaxID=7719 RepID=UPI000EF4D1D9|nr:uncharacterized protein LOC100178198 isoform X2 [Ciona intestinalis]|eukprot:XP_026692454.1 uncharacterized protein LOC100178198 isoform X2 [Ciona intestinalis]